MLWVVFPSCVSGRIFFFEKAISQNLCVHKIHDKRYVYYRDEKDAVAASNLSQAKCKKKRLINTSFLDTFGIVSDPDSVHQLVDFSRRSKRHRAILRAAHQLLNDCKRCVAVACSRRANVGNGSRVRIPQSRKQSLGKYKFSLPCCAPTGFCAKR